MDTDLRRYRGGLHRRLVNIDRIIDVVGKRAVVAEREALSKLYRIRAEVLDDITLVNLDLEVA